MNALPGGAARRSSAFRLAAASFAFCIAADAAASGPDRPRRVELRAGATFFDADASFETVRAEVPSLGFSVDDLGIDSNGARFFASGIWRVTDRWVVQFDTFGFDNRGGRVDTLEIAVGGMTVATEVALAGSLDLDLYALNVGFRLIEHGGFEAGLGAGAHYVSLDYRATAAAPFEQGGEELASLRGSDEFPAPNPYGWASWWFTGNVRGDLKAGWLSIDSGDFDGRIYFLRTSLQYRLTDHFGIGAGYWVTDFNVDRQSSTRVDTYDVRLRGPQLYLNVAF
jgi:hypothetical protein